MVLWRRRNLHPPPGGSGTGSLLLHYFSTNRVDSRGLRRTPVDSTAADKRLHSNVLTTNYASSVSYRNTLERVRLPAPPSILSALQSMTYSHISGAEEFARELLRAAEAKAGAVARAGHPPLPTFADFATSSPPEGLIDDSATVIELVLKHRLACDCMERGDTRERRAIECEIKRQHHNAQKGIRQAERIDTARNPVHYSKCQRGYDDFASINRRMADFEEMLAWVHRGPGYRYTAALTEPHVPIGGCWSPAGTSEVKELPSFPDALVEWRPKSSRTPSLYVRCVTRLRRNTICRPPADPQAPEDEGAARQPEGRD